MNKETKGNYNGLSFSTVLFLIFLVLKLCGVIDWPWIAVFAPIWLPIFVFLVITGIMYVFVKFMDD